MCTCKMEQARQFPHSHRYSCTGPFSPRLTVGAAPVGGALNERHKVTFFMPAVAGSESWRASLFEMVSECVFPIARVD
jgi:hypothetical protein